MVDVKWQSASFVLQDVRTPYGQKLRVGIDVDPHGQVQIQLFAFPADGRSPVLLQGIDPDEAIAALRQAKEVLERSRASGGYREPADPVAGLRGAGKG